MKLIKITVSILLVLNLLIPFLQSCTKDSPKTNHSVLQNLVGAYNKDVHFEQDKAIFIEGEMTIITLPSKEVLFFLKKENKATHEIFLAQGTELPSNIKRNLGKVKVAYLREAMAFETQDGEFYTFTIGVRKGHQLIQGFSSAVWSGSGFGLAFWYNRSEIPSDYEGLSSTDDLYRNLRATPAECKCKLYDPQIPTDPDCTSGGPGSTSCSIATVGTIAGCSVSCDTEHSYYACCVAGSED